MAEQQQQEQQQQEQEQQGWQQLPVELEMQILSRMELPDLHRFAETSRNNAKLVGESGIQPAGLWYVAVHPVHSCLTAPRLIEADKFTYNWWEPQPTIIPKLDVHGYRTRETEAGSDIILLKLSEQLGEGVGVASSGVNRWVFEEPWFEGQALGVVASGSNLVCFYVEDSVEEQLELVVANPCFPKHSMKIRAAAVQPGEALFRSVRLGIYGDSSFYRIVELRKTSRIDTWMCYHYDSTARRWERAVMKVEEGLVILHEGPCALHGSNVYVVNTLEHAAVVRCFNLVTGTLTAVGPCFPVTTAYNSKGMDAVVLCGQEVLLLRVEEVALRILHIAILRLNPAGNEWETVSELPQGLLAAPNEGRPMLFSLSAGSSDTHLVIHFQQCVSLLHTSFSYEMSSGRWMVLPKDLNIVELFPICAKIQAGVFGSDEEQQFR